MIITLLSSSRSRGQTVEGLPVALEHPRGQDLDHVHAVLGLPVDRLQVEAVQQQDEEDVQQEEDDREDEFVLLVSVDRARVLRPEHRLVELLDLVAAVLEPAVDARVVGQQDVARGDVGLGEPLLDGLDVGVDVPEDRLRIS
jgi:hypothetical protein